MKNLIIIEDHKIVANGIKVLLLGTKYNVLAMAHDADTALKTLQQHSPDAVLLDIRLGNDSGIQLSKQIQKEFPKVKIIALSSSTDEHTLSECIKSGFSGFVSKSSSDKELITALENVENGKNYYSDDVKSILLEQLEKRIQTPEAIDGKLLTDREIEIVRLFAEGLSYKEIAAKLFISASTVDSHKYKIMEKLNVTTTLDIVKYAIKNNLIEL